MLGKISNLFVKKVINVCIKKRVIKCYDQKWIET